MCQVSRLDSSRPVYTHTYGSYDLRGLEQEQTLIGHAGHANLVYDLSGRLKTLNAPHWSESIPEGGFDAVGNLVEAAVTDL